MKATGKKSSTRGVYFAEGKWYARCFYTDDLHKRRSLKATCTSEREAKIRLKELRAEARRRKAEGIIGTVGSLNSFLLKWLALEVKPRVAPKTFFDYSEICRRYIQDGIGKKQMEAIKPLDIKQFYQELQGKGLSARSVQYVHAVLRSAFKAAVQWQYVGKSPVVGVSTPKLERKQRQVFSPDSVLKFLSAARDTRHYTLFLVAVETGCRVGEYLGLKWGDFDFNQGTVSIQRSLCWNAKGGGWRLAPPKTNQSRRSIPLSQSLIRQLKEHRMAQLEHRLMMGELYENHDFVFASEGGTPINPQNLTNRYFKPLIQKAGLPPMRLYDLRHSSATLLLATGVNPKVVAARLGHADIRLTLDCYSHVTPSLGLEATTKLETILFPTTAR